jgi:membrane protein
MNKLFDIRAWQAYFLLQVWQLPVDDMPQWRQRLIVALRIGHLVIRDLVDGMITLRAMGLVYTTILALVPLLAVSFSVLKGFGVHNQVEPLLLNLMQPLGEKGVEVTRRIIAFVDNTKAGVLGSLGLALLLYTVVSLLQKIEKAFNYTWHVAQHRSITQRFSDYLTVILIGPVLLFSALGLTASLSSLSLIQQAMQIEAIGMMIQLLARLIPYVLVIAVFTFIYMLVPNIRVHFRSALIGGFVAGILWETTSWGFTAFVVNSAKYTAIYSVFATLIIFFIWLYVNWLILLIGCNITSYHQQPSQRTLKSRVLRLSNRMRETMALMIMTLVARQYHFHQQPWTLDALAARLNVSAEVCELLVNRLVEAELLLVTADSPPAYVPGFDPATIALTDIVAAIRESGESDGINMQTLHSEPVIDNVYDQIESAIHASIQGKNLLELAQTEGEDKHD